MVQTLCNLSQLRESKFGQPDPRHGLRLLWWFVIECVHIASNGIYALHDPATEGFGFRHFKNAEGILPHHRYYKTGNLKHCDSLPYYVIEHYTGRSDDSNTDRIIVSYSKRNGQVWFDQIYVTRHSDQVHFDQNHTFCISPDLIKDIKNLRRADFLRQMKNDQNSQSVKIELFQESTNEQQWSHKSTRNECNDQNSQSVKIELFQELTNEQQWSHESTRNECDCETCKVAIYVCAFMIFIVLLIVLLIVLGSAWIFKV